MAASEDYLCFHVFLNCKHTDRAALALFV